MEVNLDFLCGSIPGEKSTSPPLGKLCTCPSPWEGSSLSGCFPRAAVPTHPSPTPFSRVTWMFMATSQLGGQWGHEGISVISWMRVSMNPWIPVSFATFPPGKELQTPSLHTPHPFKHIELQKTQKIKSKPAVLNSGCTLEPCGLGLGPATVLF